VTLASRGSHPGTRRETRGGVRDAVLAARRSPPEITLLASSPPRDARANAVVRRFLVARARPGRRRRRRRGGRGASERGGTLRPARVGVGSTSHAHGVPRLVAARRATREEFVLEGGRGRPRRERKERPERVTKVVGVLRRRRGGKRGSRRGSGRGGRSDVPAVDADARDEEGEGEGGVARGGHVDARGEGVRRGEGEREFEETGTPRSRERFRIVEGVFSSHTRPSVSPSVVVERLSLSEIRTLWN
jgi:hypothetical protein